MVGLSDVHRFPFSLFSESRSSRGECTFERNGDVSDLMDKSIGRPVAKIKGSISANNFVDIDGLCLTGSYVYVQLCLLKSQTATFHIEISTTSDANLRITVSTLYEGDRARYLGSSLRLPLPARPGWMTLELNINKIIEKFCMSATSSRQPVPRLKAIKRVQLCSSMLVRDVVTCDRQISNSGQIPRELAVIDQGDGPMPFLDIAELSADSEIKQVATAATSEFGSCLSSTAAATLLSTLRATSTPDARITDKLELLAGIYKGEQEEADVQEEGTEGVVEEQPPTTVDEATAAAVHESTQSSSAVVPPHRGQNVRAPPQPPQSRPSSSTRLAAGKTNAPASSVQKKSGVKSAVSGTAAAAAASSGGAGASAVRKPGKGVAVAGGSTNTASSAANKNNRDAKKAVAQATQKPRKAAAPASAPASASASAPAPLSKTREAMEIDSSKAKTATEESPAETQSQTTSRPSTFTAADAHQTPKTAAEDSVFVTQSASSGAGAGLGVGVASVSRPSSAAAAAASRSRNAAVLSPPVQNNGKAAAATATASATATAATATSIGNKSTPVGLTTARLNALQATGGLTPNTQTHSSSRLAATYTAGAVRSNIPVTNAADKVLVLERVLSYSGGPSLLLYEGHLIVVASGSLLVLIDVEGRAQTGVLSATPGLWRAFRSVHTDVGKKGGAPKPKHGGEQTFLKGHTNTIDILEVSSNTTLMASCESCPNGSLILWNIVDGKKVAHFQPHPEGTTAIAFSSDSSLLVTVGVDAQKRVQIVVWNLQILIAQSPALSVIARQLCEFPITKIRFSPYEDLCLVSCGRENIRFFRVKSAFLMGRPVLLNEYSRGFIFGEIAFYAEAGPLPTSSRTPCAFFTSNKGLLLKVNCDKKQVVCAYNLHLGAIRSLAIHSGYAVTGGDDSRLRVWPLDFSDFLLEAQHEAAVTCIGLTSSGRKLSIGTAAGTLGILDVSEHSYSTVLRSHVGPITSACARSPNADEFVTLGKDRTIRLWDVITSQQKFEFSAPSDEPRCAAYNPRNHTLACGFESGTMRIFDVDTTSTLLERKMHKGPVVSILFALTSVPDDDVEIDEEHSVLSDPDRGNDLGGEGPTGATVDVHQDPIAVSTTTTTTTATAPAAAAAALSEPGTPDSSAGRRPKGKTRLLMFTAGLDGNVVVYDVEKGFTPIKTLRIVTGPTDSIRMAVNMDCSLLAVAAATVSSIVVYDTKELTALYRGGHLANVTIGSPSQLLAAVTAGIDKTGSAQGGETVDSPFGTSSGIIAADPLAATIGTLTVSPAAVAGTSNLGSSESAPVTGLAFCEDRPGGSLLVSTDKHVVSLPLDLEFGSSNFNATATTTNNGRPGKNKQKRRSAWDERSVRRIDYGTPTSMFRDTATGLLFMTVNIHDSSHAATAWASTAVVNRKGSSAITNTAESSTAVVVVDAKHKPGSQNRLSLSEAQLYKESPGAPIGVCPCSPCGRVVTYDECGSIMIWQLVQDRVIRLQSSGSPAHYDYTHQAGPPETPAGPDHYTSAASALLSPAQPDPIAAKESPPTEGARHHRSRATSSSGDPQKQKQERSSSRRGLAGDFEVAASSATAEKKSKDQQGQNQDDVDGENRVPSIVASFNSVRVGHVTDETKEKLAATAAAATAAAAADEAAAAANDDEEDEDLIDGSNFALLEGRDNDQSNEPVAEKSPPKRDTGSVSGNSSEDDDSSGSGSDSDEEEERVEERVAGLDRWVQVEGKKEEENAAKTSAEALEALQNEIEAAKNRALDHRIQQILKRRRSGLAGPAGAEGGFRPKKTEVVSMRIAVPPSFSPDQKKLLLCDSTTITVKSFDGQSEEVLLPKPSLRGRHAGVQIDSITQASISPSGLFVTATVALSRKGASKKELDIAVWFQELSAGYGDWVSLGLLNVAQLAKTHSFVPDETVTSSSSSSSSTSSPCRLVVPVSEGRTIALDWLNDDTVLLVMRVQTHTHTQPHTVNPAVAATSSSSSLVSDTIVGILTAADLLDRFNTLIDSVDKGARWGHSISREVGLQSGGFIDGLRVVPGGCEDAVVVEEDEEHEQHAVTLPSTAVAADTALEGVKCDDESSDSDSDDGYLHRRRQIHKLRPPVPPSLIIVPDALSTVTPEETPDTTTQRAAVPVRKVSFVLWSGSQITYCALTAPVRYADLIHHSNLEVLFTDDAKLRGPFLCFDICGESGDDKSLWAALDSMGTLKVAVLPHCNRIDENENYSEGGGAYSRPISAFAKGSASSLPGNIRVMSLSRISTSTSSSSSSSSFAASSSSQSGVASYTLSLGCSSHCISIYSVAVSIKEDANQLPQPPPSSSYTANSKQKASKASNTTNITTATATHVLNASLAFLYKISTNFIPDYIIGLPTEWSAVGADLAGASLTWHPTSDMIVANNEGFVGFVPSNVSCAHQDEVPGSLLLHSAAPSLVFSQSLSDRSSNEASQLSVALAAAGGGRPALAVCSTARVIALLQRGKLHLFHADTGIKLPFPNPTGINAGTCITSTATTLAVGSNCGRIAVFDAKTMTMTKLIGPLDTTTAKTKKAAADNLAVVLPANTKASSSSSSSAGFRAGGVIAKKKLPSSAYAGGNSAASDSTKNEPTASASAPRGSFGGPSVVHIRFICGGTAIVAYYSDGTITVTSLLTRSSRASPAGISLSAGAQVRVPYRLKTHKTPTEAELADSTGPIKSNLDGFLRNDANIVLATCSNDSSSLFESNILSEYFAVSRGSEIEMFRVTINVPDPFIMDTSGSLLAGGGGGGFAGSASDVLPIVQTVGCFALRAIGLSDNRPVKLLPEDEAAILLKANPNLPYDQKQPVSDGEQTIAPVEDPAEIPKPFDAPVQSVSLSLFVRGGELVVTSIGSVDESEDRRLISPAPSTESPLLHMFTGVVDLHSLTAAAAGRTNKQGELPTVIKVQRLLNMGTMVSSCVFKDSYCVFVVPSGVCVTDVLAGNLASLKEDEYGYDDGSGAIAYAALTSSLSTATSLPSAWNGSIVAFADVSEGGGGGGDNDDAVTVTGTVLAYRHHKAALLRIQFDC